MFFCLPPPPLPSPIPYQPAQMVYESHGGSGMPPPSSAILPLVIGLVITVCLLLMVGCRLRYMNQRLRYGRLKTSAHDADYLINGMYL